MEQSPAQLVFPAVRVWWSAHCGQSHGLPWHRVVAAGGRIAIPGEGGLDQRFRLEMEGVKFSGRKVRMAEFEYKFHGTERRSRKIDREKAKSSRESTQKTRIIT